MLAHFPPEGRGESSINMATTGTLTAGTTGITNRRRWGVVGLLFAASMINYMDRFTISLALPSISDDLHLDPVQKGYLLSTFSWSYAYM